MACESQKSFFEKIEMADSRPFLDVFTETAIS